MQKLVLTCDVCGKEGGITEIRKRSMPVIVEKQGSVEVVFFRMDICRECEMKSTNLRIRQYEAIDKVWIE